LGDSFTWGWGVGDDEIYTEVLESLLLNVEVINLGVAAFDTQQEFDYLKMKGIKYNPDIVILGFCLNDISENSRRRDWVNNSPSGFSRPLSRHSSFFAEIKESLAAHSAFYDFVTERINMSKRLVNLMIKLKLKESRVGYEGLDPSLRPALKSYPPRHTSLFESTKSKLLAMKSYLGERNIRFIILLIPSLQSIDGNAMEASIVQSEFDPTDFDLEKPYKLIETFGKMHNIEVVNPFSSLKKAHTDGSRVFLQRDMHWNKLGHDLVAREICKYLTASPQPFMPSHEC
jgi:acetyltransferase AlgX (SGNH hydrolase-like protein)